MAGVDGQLRKARILLKANEIAFEVRLSLVFSTTAFIRTRRRGAESAIGGNECFFKIRTYPSHNKSLNPAQFVRSKMAYPAESKGDRARSSFKSRVFNICLHSPHPQTQLPDWGTSRPGCP